MQLQCVCCSFRQVHCLLTNFSIWYEPPVSLAAIPRCFAVLAGTFKSVYLSVMLVDFYYHLEMWCGVRTKFSSAQTVQGKAGLQGELVLCPKHRHFCPSLAPVHWSVAPVLRATWDKCSHAPHLETKLNLSFVAKDAAGSGKRPNPSQWGGYGTVSMQGFLFYRTVWRFGSKWENMQFLLLWELVLIPEGVRIKNPVSQCPVSGRSLQDMTWEECQNGASICPLLILSHFQLFCVKELPEPGVFLFIHYPPVNHLQRRGTAAVCSELQYLLALLIPHSSGGRSEWSVPLPLLHAHHGFERPPSYPLQSCLCRPKSLSLNRCSYIRKAVVDMWWINTTHLQSWNKIKLHSF